MSDFHPEITSNQYIKKKKNGDH